MHPSPLPSPTTDTRFTQRARHALAIALLFAACAAGVTAPAPALAAPPKKAAATKITNKTYNQSGASFQYPATWKIVLDEVDDKAGGIHNVDLQGPDDELITLSFIPFMAGKDIEAFAARAAVQRAELAAREGAAAAPPAPEAKTQPQQPLAQTQPQPQQPPVPAEQEVVAQAPAPQTPPQPAAAPSSDGSSDTPTATTAPTGNKVSAITPITATTITRRLPGGKTVKGVLHRFSYVAQDSSVPVEAGFFAMDFSPTTSVTLMTQTMVEHAKSMESAQNLVMGSLRYRPAKR